MEDIIEDLITKMTTRSVNFLLVAGLLYIVLFTLALTRANAQSGSINNISQNNTKIVQQALRKGNASLLIDGLGGKQ